MALLTNSQGLALIDMKQQTDIGSGFSLAEARTLDDVLAVLRAAARELTAADGVTIVLRDGDLCYYAEESAIGPLWKGRRFPINECVSGWAMVNRRQVVIPDIYEDPRVPLSAYEPTFVRAMAMVPIGVDRPIGAIGAYWGAVHRASVDELSALQTLAELANEALGNVLDLPDAPRSTQQD